MNDFVTGMQKLHKLMEESMNAIQQAGFNLQRRSVSLEESIAKKELEFDAIFFDTYRKAGIEPEQKIGRLWTLDELSKEINELQKELDMLILRNMHQTDIICSEFEYSREMDFLNGYNFIK